MKTLRELLHSLPTNDALRERVALIHEEAEKLRRDNEETRQENERLRAQLTALQKGIARLEQQKSNKSSRRLGDLRRPYCSADTDMSE